MYPLSSILNFLFPSCPSWMLRGDHFFLHSDREKLLRYLSEDLTQMLNTLPGS